VDFRPVIQGEVLLKFAIGAVVDVARPGITRGVGARQYGAGRAGGAELEVHEVRAAARVRPEDPIGAVDVANAFGSAEWDDSLHAANAHAPQLGPALAAQWQARRLKLWLLDADSQGYHELWVFGSLLQGGADGHPTFCLLMAVVLVRVGADGRLAGCEAFYRFWLYVDDVVVQCVLRLFRVVVEVLRDALAELQLELKHEKSMVHVPALAATAVEEWPSDFRALKDVLPLSTDGLLLLGTDASGDRALPLGPWAAAGEPTRKRAQRACRLAAATKQLAAGSPPAGGRHAA
jgi:hypothetical protein